jgi:hypothetical protein
MTSRADLGFSPPGLDVRSAALAEAYQPDQRREDPHHTWNALYGAQHDMAIGLLQPADTDDSLGSCMRLRRGHVAGHRW